MNQFWSKQIQRKSILIILANLVIGIYLLVSALITFGVVLLAVPLKSWPALFAILLYILALTITVLSFTQYLASAALASVPYAAFSSALLWLFIGSSRFGFETFWWAVLPSWAFCVAIWSKRGLGSKRCGDPGILDKH